MSFLLDIIKNRKSLKKWKKRFYSAPSPEFIKHCTIIKNGLLNSTWIETGTYLGETTRILSQNSKFVYSIEAEPKLFYEAKKKFENINNVEILNGKSEDILATILKKLNGDINFFLDAHFCGGITFKGVLETSIIEELNIIGKTILNFDKLVILIDDVRLFNPQIPEFSSYPTLDFLVDWTRTHRFTWKIEHDIFIIKNY